MTTLTRVSMAVGALAVAVCAGVLANHWLERRLAADGGVALRHKALQHAAATVTGVEPGTEDVKVCFAIDSFAELPAEDRSFYETTERARAAGHGPRCVPVHGETGRSMSAGAKLDVFFTLENGGKIAVAHVEAKGQRLY